MSFYSSFANFDPYWFDTNQPYRTAFNLSGATSNIDNYTINIDVNSSFMGQYFNFSQDRDSIRIYYYNSTTNSTLRAFHDILNWDIINQNGTIQFKAPLLENGANSQYFIYFGSISYTNEEDFCSTYLHCDFFNRTTIGSEYQTADNDLVGGTDFSISSDELQIIAGGDDTWTGDDEFGSVFLDDIEGDVDIEVAVISHGNVHPWNKAGIMMRNDMTQPTISTGYVYQVITSGNGYVFQEDSDDNGFLDSSTTASSRVLPSYLRLTKLGQTFEGFYSTTTPNTWTSVNSATKTSANSIQDIGLSLTSHSGTTLETVRYDNFTVKRYSTDTISVSSSISEFLPNELRVQITSPTTVAIQNIDVNQTFNITAQVECFSYANTSCGEVEGVIEYNQTSSSFSSISTTSTTPMWTESSNPQSCTIGANSSCSFTYTINMTGIVGSFHDLSVLFSSNVSSIVNSRTHNVTIRIIEGEIVAFNQSFLDLGVFDQFSGTRTQSVEIDAINGANSNISIVCDSGDCSQITTTTSFISSIAGGSSQSIDFSCDDSLVGSFGAQFRVNSSEAILDDFIDINCQVEKVFGPISITRLQPVSSNSIVTQNSSIIYRYNVSCLGDCGEVESTLVYQSQNIWNSNWQNSQQINITNSVSTPTNYQIALEFNNSNLAQYNWSYACDDFRFIYNDSQELDYWIEDCSSTSQNAIVWVETNQAIPAGGDYQFSIYYNNPTATTNSNVTNTFRNDEIFLVTGDWVDTAPVSSQHINDNADANELRSTIGINAFNVDGSGYVSQISQGNNIYGADNLYYSRYRFLFVPDTTATHFFGVNSDDGSEVGLWSKDGYGGGIRTNLTLNQNQEVLAHWYGPHADGTCGVSGTQSSKSLNASDGYWLDYVMNERTGGQNAELCINDGGGYQRVSSTNFANQIYAREYITPEPTVVSYGTSSQTAISSTPSDTPLWTPDLQPQTCTIGSSDFCVVEWEVNATGEINTSWIFSVVSSSNYSQVNSTNSINSTINITDTIIPTITLQSPEQDEKVFSGIETEFIVLIEGSDSNYRCELYINSVLNTSQLCSNNINSTILANITSGEYSYFIDVLDISTNASLITSPSRDFLKILNKSSTVSKSISSTSSNIYEVEINIVNNNQLEQTIKAFDFVDEDFTAGSLPPFSTFSSIIGIFAGFLYEFNITTPPLATNSTSYAISPINENATLVDNFVVGFSSQ